jgi:hypothetical protein
MRMSTVIKIAGNKMSTPDLSDDSRLILRETRHEILQSIDADALMSLATFLVGHSEVRSIELQLVVIEAIAVAANKAGSADAQKFLTEQWPALQTILPKRWARAGFIE